MKISISAPKCDFKAELVPNWNLKNIITSLWLGIKSKVSQIINTGWKFEVVYSIKDNSIILVFCSFPQTTRRLLLYLLLHTFRWGRPGSEEIIETFLQLQPLPVWHLCIHRSRCYFSWWLLPSALLSQSHHAYISVSAPHDAKVSHLKFTQNFWNICILFIFVVWNVGLNLLNFSRWSF